MRKGLTEKIDAIIEKVAELECIKPYRLTWSKVTYGLRGATKGWQ